MILDEVKLVEILKKRPSKQLLEIGSEQRKKARMHMYGKDMAHHLTMIEGFEKPWLHSIRLKYVQSNKDLFSRAIKPVVKVFTARGSSTYYNLSPKETSQASAVDNSASAGVSTKKWLETFWKMRMFDDPMGITYIEIDKEGIAYPVYKHVEEIHEYGLNGERLEYIIFTVDKAEKKAMNIDDKAIVYRVVDDLFDKIVIVSTESNSELKVTEVPGQTYSNYFGFVPGMINSPIVNPDGPGFVSPLYYVLDLADQYLLKISIRLTHELRHGFPKYWEFADDCITCKGTGKAKNAVGNCKDCKGTGKKIMLNVSDAKLLEYPTKDTPGLKGAPAGYIEPSETFSKIITAGLMELEEKVNQTLWGAKTNTKLKPGLGLSAAPNGIVTATEVMDNRQPEIETLNVFSDAAERRDKFIVDCLITKNLKKFDYIGSGGCSKNYGRRFLIEEPDALLERYTKARKDGVSPIILFGLYEQYLEAKYQSDGVSLSLHKKLMQVEPFMHYTIQEMTAARFSDAEITKKVLWSEWLSQVNHNSLILASVKSLKDQFSEYVSTRSAGLIEKKEEPASSAKN